MRRTRLLVLLALALAGAILIVVWLRTPRAPVAEQRAPPPAVERPKRPLQADAEGRYVPGYPFTVNRYRFTGFTLHPDAFVTFAQSGGGREELACAEARINAGTVHLRCDDPQVGSVTIDGTFLTRFVTDRLDAPVLSAIVTVRDGNGEILYRARDSFDWHAGEEGGR
jgi:hypothetical protein